MEQLFNNLINLFLYYDMYEPFERFCIIGGTVVALASTYFAVSAVFKVAVRILQFILTVAMIIICIAIIGCIVWLFFSMVILGNPPV